MFSPTEVFSKKDAQQTHWRTTTLYNFIETIPTHGGSPENLQNTFRTPLSGRTPVETASVCQKSFKRLEL